MTRRIATILARQGSKGFPNKNIQPFLGEPLLSRSVAQARRTGLFDTVVVSSDSEAYLQIAKSAGADQLVLRPSEMANDSVTKLPGIRHAVETCEARTNQSFDIVADLAVTSPLRGDSDILGAVAQLEGSQAPLILSGLEAEDNPYFNILEQTSNGDFTLSKTVPGRVSARQAAPQCIALNGAVYVWQRVELARDDDTVVRPGTQVFLMPKQRSIDIDNEIDFRIAEFLAKEKVD
ncbi:acylneuraminate cytidylyltransferase family protein [Actibacterium pelagium]|uniref:Posttranslational modification protein n=1 Tax=Actibacterium pelagium TaxID=2029103 RepID=A0A917EH89_9RHOB|nr:acylneuraminate cytidylyltransferase family protein [Actibacterium pelagium]GGE39584.1 posttranslational modification protein [Actibacterium pelagium]